MLQSKRDKPSGSRSRAPADTREPGLVNGVYGYAEASRLLGVTSQRVARWADGYTFPRKSDEGRSGPVLQTERHAGVLSFLELWELMFVREFAALKVPLPQIRATAEALAKKVGEFPFSASKLLVHGRQLLVDTAGGELERPDIGQLVADYAREMATRVEIRGDRVGRYDVPDFRKLVYLDREVRGGEAVVSDQGVPTRIIYSLWEAEKDIESVADYYGLEPALVSAAIRYEAQWRLAA